MKTPEELFRRNYDVEGKKQAPGVKGSTIRERDKKNAEYYIGDYYYTGAHPTGPRCPDFYEIVKLFNKIYQGYCQV